MLYAKIFDMAKGCSSKGSAKPKMAKGAAIPKPMPKSKTTKKGC